MSTVQDATGEGENNAQVFCLGAPLRIISAYSKRARRVHGKGGEHHYIEIEAGSHLITIESSPGGKVIRVMMDGRELR